ERNTGRSRSPRRGAGATDARLRRIRSGTAAPHLDGARRLAAPGRGGRYRLLFRRILPGPPRPPDHRRRPGGPARVRRGPRGGPSVPAAPAPNHPPAPLPRNRDCRRRRCRPPRRLSAAAFPGGPAAGLRCRRRRRRGRAPAGRLRGMADHPRSRPPPPRPHGGAASPPGRSEVHHPFLPHPRPQRLPGEPRCRGRPCPRHALRRSLHAGEAGSAGGAGAADLPAEHRRGAAYRKGPGGASGADGGTPGRGRHRVL
ncbi:MAG: hypothetical protein AVDCRST_MAG61-2867, partial [uncultured Friedmanniella sp.]